MNCSMCGERINEGDAFCPNCGGKQEDNNNLIIKRSSSAMGFAVKLHVTVNGITYDLSAGSIIKLKLPIGEYLITYKVWCRRTQKVTVKIEEGKICNIEFVYDPLWGGFKVGKDAIL